MAALNPRQQHRFAGTYRVVEKVDWEHVRDANFSDPDWAALYPLKANGTPSGMFTPRLACKLFYDGMFILDKTEENMKYMQDKLPVPVHKFYKKKQWRKQFIEAAHRVLCRVAKGKSFSPNCMGEELFVHVIMSSAMELGWNRSRNIWEPLPECDKDRDLGRVVRMTTNEEIAGLYRLETAPENINIKDWFRAVNPQSMTDHVIPLETEEERE
jgi:hypothetical protein